MIRTKTLDEKSVELRLSKLNDDLKEKKLHGVILLVGGNALSYNFINARSTRDIDAIIINGNPPELKSIINECGIDTNAANVMMIPDANACDTEIYKLYSNLTVKVLTKDELACAKLFTTREKDLIDLTQTILPGIKNKEKLYEKIKEYKTYVTFLNDPNLNLNDRRVKDILYND